MRYMTDEERVAVVNEAKTWLKTPYHDNQRLKGVGVDCAMFLAEVYPAVLPVNRIEVEHYPPDWFLHRDEERLLKVIEQYCIQLPQGEIGKPGDIFVVNYGRTFSHAAIIVEWPIVIHAFKKAYIVTLEDVLKNQEYASRKRRFYTPWALGDVDNP